MTVLNMTLGEVRDLLEEGVIFGHSDFHCRELKSLDQAEELDMAFVQGPDQFEAAEASHAGAFVVPEALGGVDGHQLIVDDPKAALERLQSRVSPAHIQP